MFSSFKSSIFGNTSKAPKSSDVRESIGDLQKAIDHIDKRHAHLESQAGEAKQMAAAALKKKNRDAAVLHLSRKKQIEKQQAQLMNQKINVEAQIFAIQNAQSNATVLKAMKHGAETLSTLQSQLNIDDINSTMDDIAQTVDDTDAVADALGQPIGNTLIDEDEMDDELQELQDEIDLAGLEKQVNAKPAGETIDPDILKELERLDDSAETEEERELRELEESMATDKSKELALA